MDPTTQRRLIEHVATTVIAHADALTALDQAIGDGDHGFNMKRGFGTVLAQLDDLAARPLGDALKTAGTALVMTVGGASGPLYGTLLMTLGKSLPAAPTGADVATALGTAIDAIRRLGKAEAGQKTMLDVLVPVQRELAQGGDDLLTCLPRVALAAADATIPMKATKGRASFLGDRSIGHMDPGARSCSLMIEAACTALGESR